MKSAPYDVIVAWYTGSYIRDRTCPRKLALVTRGDRTIERKM